MQFLWTFLWLNLWFYWIFFEEGIEVYKKPQNRRRNHPKPQNRKKFTQNRKPHTKPIHWWQVPTSGAYNTNYTNTNFIKVFVKVMDWIVWSPHYLLVCVSFCRLLSSLFTFHINVFLSKILAAFPFLVKKRYTIHNCKSSFAGVGGTLETDQMIALVCKTKVLGVIQAVWSPTVTFSFWHFPLNNFNGVLQLFKINCCSNRRETESHIGHNRKKQKPDAETQKICKPQSTRKPKNSQTHETENPNAPSSLVKSSKIFTAHRILRDTNFPREKIGLGLAGFILFLYMSFTLKNRLIDFSEKWAPTKVKCLLPVCQILQNFTDGNRRLFTVSFAFCAHVDVMKYQKTLTFSFERVQITWAVLLSTCAIIKLEGATLNPDKQESKSAPISLPTLIHSDLLML